jgi:hypothetical protein
MTCGRLSTLMMNGEQTVGGIGMRLEEHRGSTEVLCALTGLSITIIMANAWGRLGRRGFAPLVPAEDGSPESSLCMPGYTGASLFCQFRSYHPWLSSHPEDLARARDIRERRAHVGVYPAALSARCR